MWREFTEAWWEAFHDAEKQVSDLNQLCDQLGLMLEVRGDGPLRSQQVQLGNALLRCRDRMFGSLRIIKVERDSHHKGTSIYRLSEARS